MEKFKSACETVDGMVENGVLHEEYYYAAVEEFCEWLSEQDGVELEMDPGEMYLHHTFDYIEDMDEEMQELCAQKLIAFVNKKIYG